MSYKDYLASEEFQKLRTEAMKRANGFCELCERNPPTDTHHIQYPKRFQKDMPSNVLAICHRCHCKLHGVKD